MEISIVDDTQFTAWVNGRKHIYAVLAWHTEEETGVTYIMYMDEARMAAGELKTQLGRLVQTEERTLLLEDDGRSPAARRLCAGLQSSIDTGVMAPVVREVMEENGEAVEPSEEDPAEYPPEEEHPEPDVTPEERLLCALLDERLPDGVSPLSEVDRLARLILEQDPEAYTPGDE